MRGGSHDSHPALVREPPASRAAALLAVLLLAWSLFGNLVLGEWAYLPRNLLLTALLVVFARLAAVPWRDLGLARTHLAAGARWGIGAAVVVALALLAGLLLQDRVGLVAVLLADERAVAARAELAYHTLLRIPLGTAVFEELAFRGVLFGLVLRATGSAWRAVWWTSAVFGLWHVAPTMVALRLNDVAPMSAAGLGSIVGAVVVTAVAGVLFAWLRLRSGSLLAPVLAHWATNSLGLLAAIEAS